MQSPLLIRVEGAGKSTAIYNNSGAHLLLLLLTRRRPVLTQVLFGLLDAVEDLLKEGLVLWLVQVVCRAVGARPGVCSRGRCDDSGRGAGAA